jgi:hypothetical protein
MVPTLWSAVIFPGSLSPPNNPAAALDSNFARHGAWTTGHMLPGLLFMVLGPSQFASWIRSRRLSVSSLATAGCNHQAQRELHSD